MQHLLVTLVVGLALVMLLSLYRTLVGPTLWDRLSGLGLLGTKTIVLLLLVGLATGREDIFVDITLAYTLISFIGSLALAKYFEGKEAETLLGSGDSSSPTPADGRAAGTGSNET